MYRFIMGLMAFLTTVCFQATSRAGGDSFYYATWYAQPSETLAWSSQSVMDSHSYSLPNSTMGFANLGSPRYFQPGYGYVTPPGVFSRGFGAYGTNYAFGIVQPSVDYTGGIGSGIYSGNIWKSRGAARGTSETGTLHQPWYLPGSPGNSRAFGYTW